MPETMAAGLLAMTSTRRRIGEELARALGIKAEDLPLTRGYPRPAFGDEIDETGEGT
jgi:hypothetical protein